MQKLLAVNVPRLGLRLTVAIRGSPLFEGGLKVNIVLLAGSAGNTHIKGSARNEDREAVGPAMAFLILAQVPGILDSKRAKSAADISPGTAATVAGIRNRTNSPVH